MAENERGDGAGEDRRGGAGRRSGGGRPSDGFAGSQRREDRGKDRRRDGETNGRSGRDGREGYRRDRTGEDRRPRRQFGQDRRRDGAAEGRPDREGRGAGGYPRDRAGADRGQHKEYRQDRAPRRDRPEAPVVETGPKLPPDIQYSALDQEARAGLSGLPKTLAELVGRHLVAAGTLVDEDPERALAHARFARERASRVAVVREAAGLTAYHAGEWAEALSELRAVRRMSGGVTYLPVMADCERALGRPERALELAREAGSQLPPDIAAELRIVAAGARRDMGQLDAAVVSLQGADLDPRRRDPWSARLFYAYADNLAAAGRTEEAIRWFLNAAQADDDEETDAAERAFELGATGDE